MKTNANKSSYSGLKNKCGRERAFTLTELLVVMATLAILAAVILPALARSGDNGMQTVCLNNLRQLGMAQNMYAGENQDTMPWPNWGQDSDAPAGWLYHPNPNTPNNLQGPLAIVSANWPTYRVANLKTGVYWQYVQNPDVYICPVFAATVVGTQGPAPQFNWLNYANKLSSYCMNGASAFYPGVVPANTYGYKTCKMSQIWSSSCIILWEPDGRPGYGNDDGYNDGANYPDINEGVSSLHVTGATVLAVGGSTRFMSFADFLGEMNHPQWGDCSQGKGLLWWNPMRCDGHGKSN
jgi:prepilin-type N-terminal cleavage/methylation domain-containing protein